MKIELAKDPFFGLYLLSLIVVVVVVLVVVVVVIQGSPQTQSLLSDAFITVVFSQH